MNVAFRVVGILVFAALAPWIQHNSVAFAIDSNSSPGCDEFDPESEVYLLCELILSEFDDLIKKLQGLGNKMDDAAHALGNKIDAKIDAFERKLSANIDTFDHKLSDKIGGLDSKLNSTYPFVNDTLAKKRFLRGKHMSD